MIVPDYETPLSELVDVSDLSYGITVRKLACSEAARSSE